MDYDSMGDCGRFPFNKKRKQPITFKSILTNLIPHLISGVFCFPYIYCI